MLRGDWCAHTPVESKAGVRPYLTCRRTVKPQLAFTLLNQTTGDAMSNEPKDNKVVVLADRAQAPTSLLPVTRLVSRPSVRIVDGRLAAVLELARSAA